MRTIEKEKKKDKINNWIKLTNYCNKLDESTQVQKQKSTILLNRLIVNPTKWSNNSSVNCSRVFAHFVKFAVKRVKISSELPLDITFFFKVTEMYELTSLINATIVLVFKNSFDKRLARCSQCNHILSKIENHCPFLMHEAADCSKDVCSLKKLGVSDEQSNR